MALQQPNGNAVWSEESGAARAVSIYGILDKGTYYEFEATETPDARFLDHGNNAYELTLDPANAGHLPELKLINVGDAAIITYE